MLSNVLAMAKETISTDITLVALSYRGYLTSKGRPTEAGIQLDAQALIAWAQNFYGEDVDLVLWGQSLGAGVAAQACVQYLQDRTPGLKANILGLILETPFVSIRRMLAALYPERWVPYR